MVHNDRSLFLPKCYSQFFSTYSLSLNFFSKKIFIVRYSHLSVSKKTIYLIVNVDNCVKDALVKRLQGRNLTSPAVNFINIICPHFLYERNFGSFFYIQVTYMYLEKKLPKRLSSKKKNAKKRWWNWHLKIN